MTRRVASEIFSQDIEPLLDRLEEEEVVLLVIHRSPRTGRRNIWVKWEDGQGEGTTTNHDPAHP